MPERNIKIILLALSVIFLTTGISIFAHGFFKSRALAKENTEAETSAEESSEETAGEDQSSKKTETVSEEASNDAFVAAEDISAVDDTDDAAKTDIAEEAAGEDNLTEDEKLAMEMELAEKAAEEDSGQKYGIDYIYGVFIASDADIVRAFAPTIALRENKTFELTLNFDDNMKTYTGTFSTSTKQDEMDDLSVYLKINNPGNGVPDTATVVFSDSPDYCMFMDEGFGLMGYGGAPYYFNRDERE